MEDLTEVITCAEFHPTSCNIFMYASSGGNIKLGDMRSSALCEEHAKSKSILVFKYDLFFHNYIFDVFINFSFRRRRRSFYKEFLF